VPIFISNYLLVTYENHLNHHYVKAAIHFLPMAIEAKSTITFIEYYP